MFCTIQILQQALVAELETEVPFLHRHTQLPSTNTTVTEELRRSTTNHDVSYNGIGCTSTKSPISFANPVGDDLSSIGVRSRGSIARIRTSSASSHIPLDTHDDLHNAEALQNTIQTTQSGFRGGVEGTNATSQPKPAVDEDGGQLCVAGVAGLALKEQLMQHLGSSPVARSSSPVDRRTSKGAMALMAAFAPPEEAGTVVLLLLRVYFVLCITLTTDLKTPSYS